MKRHARKIPKNTAALREMLFRRSIAAMWRVHGKRVRIKSAKGKTGFTWQQIQVMGRDGLVGVINNVQFIESPLAA